jgi:exonuclease III
MISYNLLSPGYFRKLEGDKKKKMEASHTHIWKNRFSQQLAILNEISVDVISLQELWIKPMVIDLIKLNLSKYSLLSSQRTGKKEDGVGLLIHQDKFRILYSSSIPFHDSGERCMVIALLESINKGDHGEEPGASTSSQHVIVSTTHFTYPHSIIDIPIRYSQATRTVKEIDLFTQYIEKEFKLKNVPSILAGDFNGNINDNAVKVLLKNGFQSSFSALHNHEAAFTHIAHDNKSYACDFVFFKQPTSIDNSNSNSSHESNSTSNEIDQGETSTKPAFLHPIEVYLLPHSVTDSKPLTRPIPQTIPMSNIDFDKSDGSPKIRDANLPIREDYNEGFFSSGTKAVKDLSFEEWCHLSDHRPIFAKFEFTESPL